MLFYYAIIFQTPTFIVEPELIGCYYHNVRIMAINLEKNGYLHIETDINDERKIKESNKTAIHIINSSKVYRIVMQITFMLQVC